MDETFYGLIAYFYTEVNPTNYMKALPICFLLFLSFQGATGQTSTSLKAINSDPFSNPVIQKYYSSDMLHSIQSQDSLMFETIVYYFTQSFIVEPGTCYDCIPQDLSQFDVSLYENLRLKNERYTRDFEKQGFKLTLLSYSELKHMTPLQAYRYGH